MLAADQKTYHRCSHWPRRALEVARGKDRDRHAGWLCFSSMGTFLSLGNPYHDGLVWERKRQKQRKKTDTSTEARHSDCRCVPTYSSVSKATHCTVQPPEAVWSSRPVSPRNVTSSALLPIAALHSGNVFYGIPVQDGLDASSGVHLLSRPGGGNLLLAVRIPRGSQGRTRPADMVYVCSEL